MARKTKKRKPAKSAAAETNTSKRTSRRSVLKLVRNGAIALAAVGGAGVWTVRSVQAMQAERDLTRVGQGKPTIVQVHDPKCPTCNALQRETRKALRPFGECDLIYLVADITQAEGSTFARRYGVPHVTLLLFDGEGALRQTISGPQTRSDLKPVFDAHFNAHKPVT